MTPIAAGQVAQTHAANKVAADKLYGGKVILLKGTIGHINLDQMGQDNLILDGHNIVDGLLAWLRAGQGARSLAVGQVVQLRCEMQRDNNVAQDCLLVR